MSKLEKVIKAFEICSDVNGACYDCPYYIEDGILPEDCNRKAFDDALKLLKAQEQRHRLEVHNIGNVDIPDGVTMEQFQAIMDNVVQALEHTDKGESWPYSPKEGDSE